MPRAPVGMPVRPAPDRIQSEWKVGPESREHPRALGWGAQGLEGRVSTNTSWVFRPISELKGHSTGVRALEGEFCVLRPRGTHPEILPFLSHFISLLSVCDQPGS